MCLCTLCTERFLARVAGASAFRAYCRTRQLPRQVRLQGRRPGMAAARWSEAVGALPAAQREQIAREQAAVCELATARGNMHLLAASGDGFPSVGVAEGGPLALWFLMRRPELFWDVFRRHQHREPDVWHAARATAGATPTEQVGTAFSAPLEEFFRRVRGARRSVSVSMHRLPAGVCFVARVNSRPGKTAGSPWPAACVQVVYYPRDGTLLLQAPPAPPDVLGALLADCATALLGHPTPPAREVFDLGRLRFPFRPLPSSDGIEFVRVRTLHLRYPPRSGGRALTLQVLSGDEHSTMEAILAEHVRPDELPDLYVSHAQLHVRLPGDGRPRDHLVRLWPDRCDLGSGPAGDLVLAALCRWGF